jgi:uncharacterized membrane protein
MNKQHNKEKVHFQLERIAFFSDAVIAIALTLLIIEIKAPVIEAGKSFSEDVHQLKHLAPEFIALLLSFETIISHWILHHKLFGCLIDYNDKLIRINALFLLSIILVPFASSYFAINYGSSSNLPVIVFGISLLATGIANFFILQYVTRTKLQLFDGSLNRIELNWLRLEYLVQPIAISSTLLLGLLIGEKAIYFYIAIIVVLGLIINRKKKTSALSKQ